MFDRLQMIITPESSTLFSSTRILQNQVQISKEWQSFFCPSEYLSSSRIHKGKEIKNIAHLPKNFFIYSKCEV